MHSYLFFTGIAASFLAAFVLGMGFTILNEHRKYGNLMTPFFELRDLAEDTSCYDDSVTLAKLSNETLDDHKDELSPDILRYLQEFGTSHPAYDNDKKKQHEELSDFYEDTKNLQNKYNAEFPYASKVVFCTVVEIVAAAALLYGSHMEGGSWYMLPWFFLNILYLILSVALMCVSIYYSYFVVVCFISFILIPFRIFGCLACYMVYREMVEN